MDNRFTFLYHHPFAITEGGTKEGRPTGRSDVPGPGCRELRQANPSGHILRSWGSIPQGKRSG